MGFMSAEERALGAALSRLGYANPFLPARIEAEGAALGPAFVHADRVWSVHTDRTVQNPNVARLAERATTLAALLRERLAAGAEPAEADRVLYEDVVLYLLYTRYEDALLDLVVKATDAGDTGRRVPFYEKFRADCQHFLALPGAALRRALRRPLPPAPPLRSLAHPHRVGAVRPPPRRLHRRPPGPRWLARDLRALRDGFPGRDRRRRPRDPGEAPARPPGAHLPAPR